jgi:NitT/TauT family transport system permease protein
LLWQWGSGRVFDEMFFSSPSAILARLWQWIHDGSIFMQVWATLYATVAGFLIGAVLGLALGIWLGVAPFASRLLDPYLSALNALPKVALAPLFVLWFGIGIESKIALAAILVLFLVFLNTYTGVREVDQDLIDVMRVAGANNRQRHLRVTLPSAASWVIAGLHVSVPYAFVAAVVGEMLAAGEGLGMLIQRASLSFRPEAVFAAIAVLVVFALVLNQLVDLLERYALRWRYKPGEIRTRPQL